jgi:GTPase
MSSAISGSRSRSAAPASAAGLPRVALVGRPNAGKSTLFNRLLRRRKAIVDPTPGVTRDFNEAVATFGDRAVLLIDTGGIEAEGAVGLDREVHERSLAEAERADVAVYVLDAKAGLSPADEAAVRALRRRRARLLFVANKVDSPAREPRAADFHRVGASPLLEVSAEHGLGISDLVDEILARVPETVAAAATETPVRIGVLGRPNVGKSSLVNRLLGYPRAIVDATAGTTRDAVDTVLEVDGARYVLVDTAGIRRRARVVERLERSTTKVAIGAIERADVALVIVDAAEGATTQDLRLATLAWDAGRAVVVVANKWDLRRSTKETPTAFIAELRRRAPSLAAVPIVTVSALTGEGIEAILPAVRKVAAAHGAEIRTSRLNEVIIAAVAAQEPPLVDRRRPRIFYATQVGRRPPEIAIFTSAPKAIPPAYERYLRKHIVEAFRLTGTPVRLRFRARH